MDTECLLRGRAAEYTIINHTFRASSCPTPRRTGSRRRHSATCHALETPNSHPGSWFWIVRHNTLRNVMRHARPHIKLCHVQRNFTGYTQPLDRVHMRAFKNSIRQEVAKHFAEFFLEVEYNLERVNLESSSCCSRCAHSSTGRTAGWRFIHWTEVEQRELLAEAKRLLETGERTLTRQMPKPKPATASQRRT